MNIFYIGSSGALSLVPFKKLLSSSHTLSAVGVYKPVTVDAKVITLHNESLAMAACQHGVHIVDLSQPLNQILQQFNNLLIDIIIVSCYGHRIGKELVSIARFGCFNLHPSLLPRYRGPEPIFWQMKTGDVLGVSLHQVVHEFDAGNLVAQKRMIPDDGASYAAINQQLAVCGAELIMQCLLDVSAGDLTTMPQNHDIASYFPYPDEKDFIVDINWSAQHSYNFMRATEKFGLPYKCRTGDYCYLLMIALDYDNNATPECIEVQADRLYIPCAEGVLTATFTDRIVF